MKIIVTSLVAVSFVAILAGDADAATRKQKRRLLASQYSEPYAYGYSSRDGSGYYEQRLETLPVGSQQWWSVYERQRGGRR
jgi:hypothetical protein